MSGGVRHPHHAVIAGVPRPETPELDKQHKAIEEGRAQEIGAFLEWLDGREVKDFEAANRPHYRVVVQDDDGDTFYTPGIKELLAEYFEIDLARIEQERRALLEHLRSLHA